MTAEEKLNRMGMKLPPAAKPVGAYVPYLRTGNLIFTSGQLPLKEGKLIYEGKVGADLTLEQGYEAARVTVLNALAQIKAAVGDLEKVVQVVRLEGFVNSAPGFTGQPKVLNGASEFLIEVFGERGLHTRYAVGTSELPLNAPVELALTVEIKD